MKHHTKKLMNTLGHNNSPVNPKSIDFTNSAIEKLKVNDLDFLFRGILLSPTGNIAALSLCLISNNLIKRNIKIFKFIEKVLILHCFF